MSTISWFTKKKKKKPTIYSFSLFNNKESVNQNKSAFLFWNTELLIQNSNSIFLKIVFILCNKSISKFILFGIKGIAVWIFVLWSKVNILLTLRLCWILKKCYINFDVYLTFVKLCICFNVVKTSRIQYWNNNGLVVNSCNTSSSVEIRVK